MKSSLLLLIFGFSALIPPQDADSINFTQSAEAVAPHGNISFDCELLGRTNIPYWLINETSYDGSSNPNVIYSNRISNADETRHSLKLIIQALSDNNNTKITCYFNHLLRQDRFFIIASKPSISLPVVTYSITEAHGITLAVTWDEPFTHPGFSVNYYWLQIANSSTPNVPPSTVFVGLHRLYIHNITVLPTACSEVEYTVTAFNEIGNSSGSVSVGIPIAIQPVNIQWRVLYQVDGSPHWEFWFKPSNSCSYQEVNYTVHLLDSAGSSTLLNSSDYLYSVHSSLTCGASYTVVVEARSIAGVTVTRQEVDIDKQYFHNSYEKQISALTTSCGVMGGITVILFVIIMCLICRNGKLFKRGRTVRAFSDTVTASGVSAQRPTSLQPKCATTNPIYEGGPLYESPNGEPLCGLLGSTSSTPNTPLDSPRYIFDAFPPNLPPPRKSSIASTISLLHDSPVASPTTGEVKKIEGSSEEPMLKTGGDEYTVMRPASVRIKRTPTPSPLVIPGLSSLPEN